MMSVRLLATDFCSSLPKHLVLFPSRLSSFKRQISTSVMSYRPNYRGGRGVGGSGRPGGRGGGGRRGGGPGGRGGGGQRWWDPAWRAERLRQMAAEVFMLM